MQKIGIVGMGELGRGIAVLAGGKFEIHAYDSNRDNVEKSFDLTAKHYEAKLKVELAHETPEQQEKLIKIHVDNFYEHSYPAGHLYGVKDCDFIFDTTPDKPVNKEVFYERLTKFSPKNSIIFNTSTNLKISDIGDIGKIEEQVVGLHFPKLPTPEYRVAELVKTSAKSEEILLKCKQLLKDLDVNVIEAEPSPGYVVSRLLLAQCTEAVKIYDEGVASKEEIDAGMKFVGLKGPIEMLDNIGLDTALKLLKLMKTRGVNVHIPESLREKVMDGKLGRKSGEGYYTWNDEDKVNIVESATPDSKK